MTIDNAERDFRMNMVNSFLKTPHRQKELFTEMHKEFLNNDPYCYVHMAAWYSDTQSIRDHKELFAAHLIANDFDNEYRNVGLAMIREMPPYQIARVVKYVKENLGKVPTCLKTEVSSYLREREEETRWFDSAILSGRKHLKYLYATLRIAPGGPQVDIEYKGKKITTSYADAILFKNVYPKESSLPVLNEIRNAKSEKKRAELIVKNNIPFRVVVGLVKEVTPMIAVAMLNNMSPQDVINNLGMLKRHGCMDNSDIKDIIKEKIDAAKGDKRAHTLKTKVAAEGSGVSNDIKKALADVADVKIKSGAAITRPTAIFVDKSGSMHNAIEVGKQVAAIASAISEAGLYVYAFDTISREVTAEGTKLSDWEKAFKPIRANSSTSIGSPFRTMISNNVVVENIVIITDEEENRAPYFASTYRSYCEQMNVEPSVIIVRVDANKTDLQRSCDKENIEYTVYDFDGDYYSLQDLVPLLAQRSVEELLEEIMEYPLPERKIG